MRTSISFSKKWISGLGFLLALPGFSAEPEGYYESAYGKSGYELKTALFQIIGNPDVTSYDGLWSAFRQTDATPDGQVWDMYADCGFEFGSDQCGNYKDECDCYNREHSFPKSWFDDASPMYSDLFHLYPTDGKVNGMRGNHPFGEVDNPDWESASGCKRGPNSTPGYSGTVFEPLDEYKGDFARTYFYMATCYQNRIANWSACPICNGTSDQAFDDWVVDLLLEWHEQDPVSAKETERNDAVYYEQGNRNPFIDHPELVGKIWGDDPVPFGQDPLPGQKEYALPYAYSNAAGTVLFSDTLEMVLSEDQAKSLILDILFPADADTLYSDLVEGKVSVSGTLEGEPSGVYSLKEVRLGYDARYSLEVSLLADNALQARSRSEFHILDTLSMLPDPDPDPDTGRIALSLPYAYKDAEGKVLKADTLHVSMPQAGAGKTGFGIAGAGKTEAGETVLLLREDFENLEGADNSGTQADETLCAGVESFEGSVFAVESGVRLASGSKAGQVHLAPFSVSGPFSVTIEGKGWSQEELECKLLCLECTVEEQPVVFTQSKNELGSGQYEALEPFSLSPKNGSGTVSLTISAQGGKRAFIGKVEATAENPGPEPEPEPEPGPDTLPYWNTVTIVSPLQAEELLETTLSARIRLENSQDASVEDGNFRLPEMELENGKAYFLELSLWKEGRCLDEASVGFSVKGSEPGPDTLASGLLREFAFELYPNPNNGSFTLELPAPCRVEIFSLTGIRQKYLPEVSGSVELYLPNPGVYVVRASNGRQYGIKKMVVRP